MAKSKNLNITRSNNSVAVYGRDFPVERFGFKTELLTLVEQTLVVPGGVDLALFGYSPGANVQVTEGTVAEGVPTSPFSNTNALLNPVGVNVKEGDTLRFISPVDTYLFVSFYSTKG